MSTSKRSRTKAENNRMFCNDCGQPYAGYMVYGAVWKVAWKGHTTPASEHDRVLCLDCLAQRLGRALLPSDFDLDLPINQGIKLGIELGRWIYEPRSGEASGR